MARFSLAPWERACPELVLPVLSEAEGSNAKDLPKGAKSKGKDGNFFRRGKSWEVEAFVAAPSHGAVFRRPLRAR